MPISSLAQILIRLFATYYFLSGLFTLPWVFSTAMRVELYSLMEKLLLILPYLGYSIGAIILWVIAPRFSRFMTKECREEKLDLKGLKEVHLYNAGFLCVGVAFILSSIGEVISLTQEYILNKDLEIEYLTQPLPTFYDFAPPGITIFFAILVTATSKKLAQKVARKPNKSNQAA